MEDLRGSGAGANYHVHAWLIIAGSLLALGGMAVHPSGNGRVMDMVRDLVANGGFNAYVHGFLIAVYLSLVLAFFGLTRWLGGDRIGAQAGFVAYCASVIGATAAAMSAGFVNRTLAFNYLDSKPDEVNSVVAAFRVAGAFNYAWGRLWMIALSAAILLWSIELLRLRGFGRLLGWVGLAIGIVGVMGLPLGLIPLTVVALVGVIAAQTAWSIGVGVLLLRSRSADELVR